jgi:hypothetical protein
MRLSDTWCCCVLVYGTAIYAIPAGTTLHALHTVIQIERVNETIQMLGLANAADTIIGTLLRWLLKWVWVWRVSF